jgi:hypothetical protein
LVPKVFSWSYELGTPALKWAFCRIYCTTRVRGGERDGSC